MQNKISFVVLDHTGSSIKQATVSKAVLHWVAFFLLISLILLGWVAHDYVTLRSTVLDTRCNLEAVTKAKTEIVSQREQIQEFATKIDALKSRIANLNELEGKIRVIANLETEVSDQEGVFGVGGSLPDNLDPKLAVTESHRRLISEMHEQVDQLDTVAAGQQDRFKTLLLKLENKRNLLAATPSIWPADGWITSKFGYRTSPFTNRREFHKGLDIAARSGSPILATADGVVTYAGKKGLLGYCVVINHGHGMVTRYGHARKLLKKRGDKVKRGDAVAEIGNTGRSTGPHVHYEVYLNNVPVNPRKYIMN